MASTEGPTVATTNAVNLSVNEDADKAKRESVPEAPKEETSNDTTVILPSTSSEKACKPTVDSDKSPTSPTSATLPSVNKSTPNLPSPLPTDTAPNNSEDKAEPAKSVQDSPKSETVKETEEKPLDNDVSKTTAKPESEELGTPDVESVSEVMAEVQTNMVPDQSCENKKDEKPECDNTVTSTLQELKKCIPDENEAIESVTGTDKSDVSSSSVANGETSTSSTSLPKDTPVSSIGQINDKPMEVDSTDVSPPVENPSNSLSSTKANKSNHKRPAEDSDKADSNKKQKTTTQSSLNNQSSTPAIKGNDKSDQILEYMGKTFEQRRKIITKQMPTIPELKGLYPDLFNDKQLVTEFQRITKIDIDQKIQEFCVCNATAVIEMARKIKGSQPVLARWEQAKQENETLKQYWDMVTALCLLPLHFGENFVEMVLEIDEDEEVQAQGKIVPTLVARGNIFRTDEFFLIAENTVVQEFEEFTIAFASLYASYWVFNMVYPETIENTYNFIQRCIVKQKEPGAIPTICKNFTKELQKWNKSRKKTKQEKKALKE